MESKNIIQTLRLRLYAWLLLVVFFASAFSSISIELCHQIMHIPDYLSQSVTMHDRSHDQQDHTHSWIVQTTDQNSEDQLKESVNPLKLQLIDPSQSNTSYALRFYEIKPDSYELIRNSEPYDIPVPPPLFA